MRWDNRTWSSQDDNPLANWPVFLALGIIQLLAATAMVLDSGLFAWSVIIALGGCGLALLGVELVGAGAAVRRLTAGGPVWPWRSQSPLTR